MNARKAIAWGIVLAVGVASWTWGMSVNHWSQPKPEHRLLAIFLATIAAQMLQPIPGAQSVFFGVGATVLTGALDIERALAGYSDKVVWLVLAAYFLSRAFLKTGLARRVALLLIRVLGRKTLGLGYAFAATDLILASSIPSNAARVGGVILPITKSLADLFASHPGPTASRLGRYLILTLYQIDVICCAMFLTGQAGNPLAAEQARRITSSIGTGEAIDLGYGTWFLYAFPPAFVSLLVVPWLTFRLCTPTITETPAAARFATDELEKMGPIKSSEIILAVVLALTCFFWVMLGAGQMAAVALTAALALLAIGVLDWNDVLSERGAWDVFVWYGGLVMLGDELNQTGLTRQFAEYVIAWFVGWPWGWLFLASLLIYFYVHYAFASITMHLIAMYPPFLAVLIAAGAPIPLAAVAFAFFANIAAGLTNYGTTPAHILFREDYVPQATWWRIGFLLSLVHLGIWLTVGMFWWRIMGLW